MKTRDRKFSHLPFSFKTNSVWCSNAVMVMSGVLMGPRASQSVLTRVGTARVWDLTRVSVSRALEERTVQNVRIRISIVVHSK